MAAARESIPFPPVSQAQADGLLMLGGRLSPNWLLEAYRRGIFPWPVVEDRWEVLAWFSPDPRAIIELDGLHISRRLRRRIRSGIYRVTSDESFRDVVEACAAPRRTESGTWITPAIIQAYTALHQQGHAHSVEVWHDEQLVGGIYGVSIGAFFAGESMFFRMRDASKVALAYLVEHLCRRGFVLLDVQQSTGHIRSMGATEIPRSQFLHRLQRAIELPVSFGKIDGRWRPDV